MDGDSPVPISPHVSKRIVFVDETSGPCGDVLFSQSISQDTLVDSPCADCIHLASPAPAQPVANPPSPVLSIAAPPSLKRESPGAPVRVIHIVDTPEVGKGSLSAFSGVSLMRRESTEHPNIQIKSALRRKKRPINISTPG